VLEHHEYVRSAEEISLDLGKALQCSPSDLAAARQGILPISCFQPLLTKVLRPLGKSAALILAPFIVAAFASSSHSIVGGFNAVISTLGNLAGFAEDHGWFRTILYVKGILVSVGWGVYYATKIPMDLVADMLGKRVRMAEGRVTTREEEKKVRGKRDEVSFYYFHLKEKSFPVSRKAFTAIDDGGSYRIYYTPRSQTLVAIEPTVLAKEAEERELQSRAAQAAPDII
jgi:hypothetical protein